MNISQYNTKAQGKRYIIEENVFNKMLHSTNLQESTDSKADGKDLLEARSSF